MKIDILPEKSLYDTTTVVLNELYELSEKDLGIIEVTEDYFRTLINHPLITDYWTKMWENKPEEHPYRKEVIKGQVRFMGINWRIINE